MNVQGQLLDGAVEDLSLLWRRPDDQLPVVELQGFLQPFLPLAKRVVLCECICSLSAGFFSG